MQFTNKSNLPPAVYNLLTFAGYNSFGDISTTRLIKPVRIVTLFERHKEQIEQDVQSLSWSALGQAVHVLLERSAGDDVRVETRLSTQVYGWTVSGQPDVYTPKGGIIDDYKVTGVYQLQKEGKAEWEQQMNINAMLHRINGDEVNELRIIAFLRDWMRAKADVDSRYPQYQIHVLGQPVWEQDKCIQFVEDRVAAHQDARKMQDSELPLCTPEERWYRSGGFPVLKNNNKKADKVLPTQQAAEDYVAANTAALKPGRYFLPIEERAGENVRCLHYCEARGVCDFGRSLVAQKTEEYNTAMADPALAGEE